MTEKFSIKCGDIQKADSIEDLKEKVANLPEGTELLIYYLTIKQDEHTKTPTPDSIKDLKQKIFLMLLEGRLKREPIYLWNEIDEVAGATMRSLDFLFKSYKDFLQGGENKDN